MSMQASFTPNNPKLRASCDACFLAKVKCSKSRPMCSRCLAFGSDCKYSPSSRAGKPKAEGKASRATNSMDLSPSEGSNVSAGTNYPTISINFDTESSTSYCLETDWSTSPTSEVGREENSRFVSNGVMHAIGDPSSSEARSSHDGRDLPDPFLYWTHTPPTDITSPYLENTVHLQPNDVSDASHLPSVSFWLDQADSLHFLHPGPRDPQPGLPPNLFVDECPARTATCGCFNSCVQTLQTLHNFNVMPTSSSFDIVLAVNQKAMQTCSATLHCPICNSQSGSSLRTMLLGTILGRIILIYQDSSKNYFGPTAEQSTQIQSQPLTFGIYRVASEDSRWLQLVIILRDLKKFKVLVTKFQEASMKSQSQEDVEMHSAVTNHLYQSLHLTCEAFKKHKNTAWE